MGAKIISLTMLLSNLKNAQILGIYLLRPKKMMMEIRCRALSPLRDLFSCLQIVIDGKKLSQLILTLFGNS